MTHEKQLAKLFAVVLLLRRTVGADPIPLRTALDLRLDEVGADPLQWVSDVHLRTAAFHEDVAGFDPTGATATARTLLTETRLADGRWLYEFDPRRLSDVCGRVQLDLESIAGGASYGGTGAYLVVNLGEDCNIGKIDEVKPLPDATPEPSPGALVAAGLFLLWLAKAIGKRKDK